MNIKILGSGCPNCKKLYANTEDAIKELKISAALEKVEDINQIIDYGVMKTPALVVDGNVVFAGKVASKDEIIQILKKAIK